MCGIAGFIDFKGRTEESVLKKMTDSLRHRGPDASGYFFTKKDNYSLGLGHRRLSIIDLSPLGNQPMQLDNGNYQLIFNGEIYNYQEIKSELSGLGHHFISTSDTEVILHSFKEWGPDAVKKFIGMFVIVIYDVTKEEVTCFRDRAGVKPLFYYWKDGVFLFASELKGILQHPGFTKEINLEAVASYMEFGYIPTPHSIYKNTWKLEQRSYLTLNLRTREITTSQYWDVHDSFNQPKLRIDFDEALLQTEKVLEKAFSYRMVADVPVGVFLSGGYDSVCVTALLQKNMTDKLKTFTIGMADSTMDEAPYAKEVARRLGTEHQEFYCTEKNALDIIPSLPYYYDEPMGDNSAIPTILVSRMAREHVTVALSADGGDEIFGGYNRYHWMLRYEERMKKIPALTRKVGAALLDVFPDQWYPPFRKNNLLRIRYDRVKTLLKDPSPHNIFMTTTAFFSDKAKKELFKQDILGISSGHDGKKLKPEYFDLLSYICALDYETYMMDDVLQKADRATMSVSLEGREPFLDQHIIEWAAKLPNEFKIKEGKGKYILRKIVHKYVDEKIMDRPKKGFSVPVATWLENDLRALMQKYCSKKVIEKQGIFNYEQVQDMLGKFYHGRKEKHERLWFLLMFQLWYEKWMDNNLAA